MKRRFMIIFLSTLFLCSSIITSGCATKEVEDLAVVTLWSWDRVTVNGTDKYQIWTRLMRPPKKDNQDTQTTGSKSSDILLTGTGTTLQDAIMDFMSRTPRSPFFGQVQAVIFGERFAREKAAEAAEANLRYPEERPGDFYFVTKGEASRLLQMEPTAASTLSKQIKKQAETTALNAGLSCGVTAREFDEWLLSPDRDAVLPEIEPVEPKKGETVPPSVIVRDFGVFQGAHLVGWLNADESRGYLLITQKLSNAQIPVYFIKDDKMLTYWLTGFKSKIEPQTVDGNPSFKIIIQTQGIVNENDNLDLTSEEVKVLEQIIAAKVRELPLKTIAKAKEYDADFLGLMEKFHRYQPSAWAEIAPDWRESFRRASVEVEVDAKILSGGMVSKSFHIKS
ncbi:Ger(x)C family spore germination protein [Desulfosporosinus sp. SB140]|uniref:Ger(x)C family spore germination protein n=1 Tax=Desulfosporosinus paludis TaxID=3115649 RepID=UPI00388D4A49